MATDMRDAVQDELDAVRHQMNKLHNEFGMTEYLNSRGKADSAMLGRLTAIRQLLTRANDKFQD